ncbi:MULTISPECIES: OB-fold domain-containing protein [unclassified Streptomyces]|uniref:OB-fold domain-containing protein n=1 Tax=unclassified Streptomyces TaxID=2593676 RepID=UPI000F4E2478|nr:MULTISPECIES: OB-fold domain-containing protein [unclassified Streptomyces]MDH6455240.1 putative OB-fold protein [Streptomyces sp. SAI-119]MDH6494207.1 putative OB-fold protein [Streptomyces sp. SAI-149]
MLQTASPEPFAGAVAVTADPPAPEAGAQLLFQSCLWCGTAAYRRSFCRACGSTAFKRQRSAGAGALVRRIGQPPLNIWFVAMDEEFTLVCRLTGAEPAVIRVGARVRVVVAPREQGLPLVELTRPPVSSERWW